MVPSISNPVSAARGRLRIDAAPPLTAYLSYISDGPRRPNWLLVA